MFQKNKLFYERLFDALEILAEFFHANDKGLTLNKLENPLYKVRYGIKPHFMLYIYININFNIVIWLLFLVQEVHTMLRLHKAETHEIIQIYFKEKINEQVIKVNYLYIVHQIIMVMESNLMVLSAAQFYIRPKKNY